MMASPIGVSMPSTTAGSGCGGVASQPDARRQWWRCCSVTEPMAKMLANTASMVTT
jgi:hypothetical protein